MTAKIHIAKPQYCYASARDRCRQYGLVFDERLIPLCESAFQEAKLTQHQVDLVLEAHIEATAFYWNRKSYSLWRRILMALYWLGVGKNIGRKL